MVTRKIKYILICFLFGVVYSEPTNGIMFQFFEWYSKPSENLWQKLSLEAASLSKVGVTAVWIPPAYKGTGIDDAGYGVYDKYDLGEFNQNGTIRTKYGSKAELISAVNKLHLLNIQVYGDIVLNQIVGGDKLENVTINQVDNNNRNYIYPKDINATVWTKFMFPNRNNKYSSFTYDASVISGIDGPNIEEPKVSAKNIYLVKGHNWAKDVDDEYGNYDYLLGNNLDYSVLKMRQEAMDWGRWFTNTLKLDGYRIDAVKHLSASFMKDWLSNMRKINSSAFAVGEYWSGSLAKLENYEQQVNWSMSLFDVPLHYNLYNASKDGNYDLRKIFDNTMVQKHPVQSVTFVDNHDTEPGQALASFIDARFKQRAYALILTREGGYPCVFYGDYFGIPTKNIKRMDDLIVPLMEARRNNAYGKQHDYFVDPHYIGWTRDGDDGHDGLATIVTNGNYDGYLDMNVGTRYRGTKWYDITGNYPKTTNVTIDLNGVGHFLVKANSVSVWVPL